VIIYLSTEFTANLKYTRLSYIDVYSVTANNKILKYIKVSIKLII